MNNIGELIKRSGYQRKELATELNVSQATISDWSTGKKTPRGNNLNNLSVLFNVPYSVILGYEPLPDADEDEPPAPINMGTIEDKQILDSYHALTRAGREYIKQQLAIAQKIYSEPDSVPIMEDIG